MIFNHISKCDLYVYICKAKKKQNCACARAWVGAARGCARARGRVERPARGLDEERFSDSSTTNHGGRAALCYLLYGVRAETYVAALHAAML